MGARPAPEIKHSTIHVFTQLLYALEQLHFYKHESPGSDLGFLHETI